MDALKNSGFTDKEENISNDSNKEKNKEYGRKIEKEKIYGPTPHFVD